MMTLHKEGYRSIALGTAIFIAVNLFSYRFLGNGCPFVFWSIFSFTLIVLLFLVSFFRSPNRKINLGSNHIISPADGKVVVIEEVYDAEYFMEKRLQVSIFMSPANVHINRNPISGEVMYSKYHKGQYLVAWHPKSSELNERWSMVIKNQYGEILCKQVAGALARRICNYLTKGQKVNQGDEYGFIKFGSRVDVLLPISTKVLVTLNQKVVGGVSVLGEWSIQ